MAAKRGKIDRYWDEKGQLIEPPADAPVPAGPSAAALPKGKQAGTAMPKQQEGESASEYSARIRLWREGKTAQAQAKAIEK